MQPTESGIDNSQEGRTRKKRREEESKILGKNTWLLKMMRREEMMKEEQGLKNTGLEKEAQNIEETLMGIEVMTERRRREIEGS